MGSARRISLSCLILTKVIHNAKKLYYNNIILRSKNKIKSTWKIINSESGITHQDTSIPLLKLDDKLIANQHKIANLLNWQYASTYEIRNIIKSLKPKNTYGYDEISNRIIKLSSPYINSPLTYICNAALGSGVFPDRLKYAIVKPIYKKVVNRIFQTIDQFPY